MPYNLGFINEYDTYCVVRDIAQREFVIVTGEELLAKYRTGSFQRFTLETLPANHAPVHASSDDKFIAVWCDPTKPEIAWYTPPAESTEVAADPLFVELDEEEAGSEPEPEPVNVAGIAIAAARTLIRAQFPVISPGVSTRVLD